MIADKNIKSFLVLQKILVIRREHVVDSVGRISFCWIFVACLT